MSLSKGLDALREKVADAAKAGTDLPKAKWFALADGESKRVRFLQELDEEATGYDAERGIYLLASEVSNPEDYRKKCVSTLDTEGRCFGVEMHQRMLGTEGYKNGWRPKNRVYINALVEERDGDTVEIFSSGLGAKSIIPALVEAAAEYKTITNRWWKITRTGKDFNNTSYTLLPLKEDSEPFDYSDIELYDLDKVAVRHVPYAEQAAFFGFGDEVVEGGKGAASTDVDW